MQKCRQFQGAKQSHELPPLKHPPRVGPPLNFETVVAPLRNSAFYPLKFGKLWGKDLHFIAIIFLVEILVPDA